VLVEEGLPGFEPRQQPSPPSSLSDDPTLTTEAADADADGGPGDAAPGPRSRSSRASTEPLPPVDGHVVVEVFKALLMVVSTVLHWVAAPRRPRNDVWVADQSDLEAIAPPLARIAARHVPLARFVTSDLADGLLAATATAAYVDKNLDRRAQLRDQADGPPADLTADHEWSAPDYAVDDVG